MKTLQLKIKSESDDEGGQAFFCQVQTLESESWKGESDNLKI